jgi:hypothetical protein
MHRLNPCLRTAGSSTINASLTRACTDCLTSVGERDRGAEHAHDDHRWTRCPPDSGACLCQRWFTTNWSARRVGARDQRLDFVFNGSLLRVESLRPILCDDAGWYRWAATSVVCQ